MEPTMTPYRKLSSFTTKSFVVVHLYPKEMSAMRSLAVFLMVFLSSMTLSDSFQHFSLSIKAGRAPTRLFVASPTSKFRVFDPKYRAPLPTDAKSFNEPVTFEEVEQNVLKVVEGQLPDQDCNLLCWRCLGYKFDETNQNFTNDGVMNRWKAIYPQPVDLVGLYDTENFKIDRPVEYASKELWRTVAEHYRDALTELSGFEQIEASKLTINIARRIIVSVLATPAVTSFHSQTFMRIL